LWKKAVSPNGSTKCGVNGETVAKFTDDDLLGFESVHDGWLVFRLTRYGAASSLAWNPISGAARGHWRGHAGRKNAPACQAVGRECRMKSRRKAGLRSPNAGCGLREWGKTPTEANAPSSVAPLRRVEGNEADLGTRTFEPLIKADRRPEG
jgi:hypothetical protein